MPISRPVAADSRYTITPEFCGHEARMHVVRFCGKWLDSFPDKAEAERFALRHYEGRQAKLGHQVADLETKRQWYREGRYVVHRSLFSGPTGQWTDDDWIKAIDMAGCWRPVSKAAPITRADVEALAASEGKPVLEILTLLQAGAAHIKDREETLEELTAIKAEILAERGV